jgi:excisionase family DNA binding protein
MSADLARTGRPSDRNGVCELPELLDTPALAACLSITERHVRRLVAERRIPFVKVGRFVRFDPVDVARWLEDAKTAHRLGTHLVSCNRCPGRS